MQIKSTKKIRLEQKISMIGVLTLLTFILISTYSCKKPKPDDNPQEVITTIKLTFTEGSQTKIFQFRDLDGLGGGLDGVADTINLDSSKTYNLMVEVLDESSSPATIVSDEIRKEGVDHQFFFNISAGLLMTQSYDDLDANGAPIGLMNIVSTSSKSNGILRINLKHQPGIKNGNQAAGESDIDVSFQTLIQ